MNNDNRISLTQIFILSDAASKRHLDLRPGAMARVMHPSPYSGDPAPEHKPPHPFYKPLLASDLSPLYRLRNPVSGEHFYTTCYVERYYAINTLHFDDEGVAAYVIPAPTEEWGEARRAYLFPSGQGH